MRKLLNWFRLRGLERDLDRELRYHAERRVSELTAQGATEVEARRQIRLELGGTTQLQEEARDIWLGRWVRDCAYDLRFAARSFLRSPSFTATAVLSLALGIGATTAIYSLVEQVVLRALPVREPERLVLVDWAGDSASVNGFGTYNLMPYPLCRELQKQTQSFEGVLCRAATTVNLSTGRDARPAAVELVSGSYFSVLGVQPELGRLLTDEDDQVPGTSPVVVLSHEFWRTQFAGDPDVVGRKVLVNTHPMTVVGVAARGFHGVDVGEVAALWIPATMSAQAIPGFTTMLDRRTRWMQILGRLRAGASVGEASAGLQPWFKAMLEEDSHREGFPKITAERRKRYFASTLTLVPAPQGHSVLRRNLSKPLWVLLAATGVLLGLACLNVAGLFLARGSAREREISTRLALGASRGRIGRQLIVDSVLIALVGGAVGVALAPLAMRALIAFLPTDFAGTAVDASLSVRLLSFSLAVSMCTGLLAGLAPSAQFGRGSLIASLRERGGTGSLRLRRVMVTAQIAFTLILVIGAALFVRTLTGLLAKGPGFDTSSLISFGIDPFRNGYKQADGGRLIQRIHDEIRASKNAKVLALARVQMLNGGSWNNIMTIQTDQRITTDRTVHLNAVTPEFFSTLGARVILGRDFEERDTVQSGSEGRPRVAIVNESYVKRYFDGKNPLGSRISERSGPDVKADIEVVGVVANISYRGVREESEQAFFPLIRDGDLNFYEGGNFYIRVYGPAAGASQWIRKVVRDADPTLPLTYLRTLDEQVTRSLNTERMLATLSASFGTLALLLSLVGLYGVMSFVVTQRTREIGIRVALGATRVAAVWMVLRDALVMIGAGVAIALPCVWMLGRLIESQLYGVKPTDPGTVVMAVVILGMAAMGAALIPARRASAVDPTEALRFE